MIDAESKDELKNLGIEHFLPKPYSGRDVLKAVDQCLSHI